MANVIVNDQNLKNIANAIREKNSTSTQYLPSEMATAISNIQVGGGNGKRVETGNTTSYTINTGLTKIEKFILFSKKINSIGLISLVIEDVKNIASIVFCGDYSLRTKACGTKDSSSFNISAGTFTWNGGMQEERYMAGTTYTWIAIGE